MKKILNKRLETISAFIKENDSVIDIGCDHSLLGIYLVLNRNKIRVLGSDINEKPLMKAKENLIKYHLEDKIELRLGNGLDVMDDNIDTIVISGMGSINIINILKNINKYPNVKKLILSPNNDFMFFRFQIGKLGFMINKEKIVFENGKYYLISECIKGNKKVNLLFGKLDTNDKEVISYYQYLYNLNKTIYAKLSFVNKIKKINLLYQNMLIKRKIKI